MKAFQIVFFGRLIFKRLIIIQSCHMTHVTWVMCLLMGQYLARNFLKIAPLVVFGNSVFGYDSYHMKWPQIFYFNGTRPPMCLQSFKNYFYINEKYRALYILRIIYSNRISENKKSLKSRIFEKVKILRNEHFVHSANLAR